MNIHYYLTIFPMEALIASHHDPTAFGAYMATGSRKGSTERLMFFEVSEAAVHSVPEYDGEWARQRCIPHSDGRPKNSVYLSVYRVLERMPIDGLAALHLVTKDGRVLPIERTVYTDPDPWKGYALYKELCPAPPLVVSALNPKHFAEYIISDANKVTMPAIVFADLSMPELEGGDFTGNVGGYFDNNKEHLKACLDDLRAGKGKLNKIVDRSYNAEFSYQVFGRGVYVGSENQVIFYPMPDRGTLKKEAYDWGKSALIF